MVFFLLFRQSFDDKSCIGITINKFRGGSYECWSFKDFGTKPSGYC